MWKDIPSWAAALLICLGCAAATSLGHPVDEIGGPANMRVAAVAG